MNKVRCARALKADIDTDNFNAEAQIICKTLMAMPEWEESRSVGIYLSMPSGEAGTAALVRHALTANKTVYIPYTYENPSARERNASTAIMDMVELHSMRDVEEMLPDRWGIPTPAEESISDRYSILGMPGTTANSETPGLRELDLIVMPGMGFDTRLGRLGHGKGFYDFFLSRYETELSKGSKLPTKMPFLGMSVFLSNEILTSDYGPSPASRCWSPGADTEDSGYGSEEYAGLGSRCPRHRKWGTVARVDVIFVGAFNFRKSRTLYRECTKAHGEALFRL